MRVVLLGHNDIASVCAMHRLIDSLPNVDFHVYLSGSGKSDGQSTVDLIKLDDWDRHLCRSFLSSVAANAYKSAKPLANPNAPEGLAELRRIDPDLIVSIRYRRVLQAHAIAIPSQGVLNLHSGILPAYRGMMATFWAMLNHEPEIGTTLHRIVDAGIDTGPVIDISRRALQPQFSYLSNVLSLYADGCEMIATALRKIDRGEDVEGVVQPPSEGAYFSTPDRASLELFFAAGRKLFDGSEVPELSPL